MFYSTRIFREQVFDQNEENAVYATVGVGAVNVLTTCVSVKLVRRASTRDTDAYLQVEHPRLGRRLLLLIGNGAMIACMVLLSLTLVIIVRLKLLARQTTDSEQRRIGQIRFRLRSDHLRHPVRDRLRHWTR